MKHCTWSLGKAEFVKYCKWINRAKINQCQAFPDIVTQFAFGTDLAQIGTMSDIHSR